MKKKIPQVLKNKFKSINKKRSKKNKEIETLSLEEEIEVLTPTKSKKINIPLKHLSNKNKKISEKELIYIIIISLVILTIMLSVKIFININKKISQEEQFLNNLYNQNRLIRVRKNNKYGYIDTKGKIKIKIKYDEASDFYGKYALVKEKEKYKIITEEGQTKIKSNKKIEYIENLQYWIIDDNLYNITLDKLSNDNLKIKSTNDSYLIWIDQANKETGIMNSKGEKTYTYALKNEEKNIYVESVEEEFEKHNYCIVNINNQKYGILNCETGEEIYKYQENKIVLKEKNIYEIFSSKTNKLKETIYIHNNKIIYSAPSNITLKHYDTYIQIRDSSKPTNERYSYLNTKNNKISNEKPDTIKMSNWEKITNYKKTDCNNKTLYGLTYKDKEILECKWQEIQTLDIKLYKYLKYNNKNYILAKKDDKWQIINLENKKIVKKFNTTFIVTDGNSTFMYFKDKKNSSRKIYNLITKKTLSIKEDSQKINLYTNYITIKDPETKELRYYNNNLKLIYKEKI